MPLFHCGSGSSIYNGTAVALRQCCLTLGSKGKGKKVQGYTHIHTQTEADNGARFAHVTGRDVWRVDECLIG